MPALGRTPIRPCRKVCRSLGRARMGVPSLTLPKLAPNASRGDAPEKPTSKGRHVVGWLGLPASIRSSAPEPPDKWSAIDTFPVKRTPMQPQRYASRSRVRHQVEAAPQHPDWTDPFRLSTARLLIGPSTCARNAAAVSSGRSSSPSTASPRSKPARIGAGFLCSWACTGGPCRARW